MHALEISFIDEVTALCHETEDGWDLGLGALGFEPNGVLLQARPEPGVLESRGLVPMACFSFAIWPRGIFLPLGKSYDSRNPEHRTIIESHALPSIWYVRYGDAGLFGQNREWRIVGRGSYSTSDPDKFRKVGIEKVEVPVRRKGTAEEFMLRYATGSSLGSRLGGAMQESWAWPVRYP